MILVDSTVTRSDFSEVGTPVVCFHCGEPVPAGGGFHVVSAAGKEPVCCLGCQAVAENILGNGLGDYYRYRSRLADGTQRARTTSSDQFAIYDSPDVQRSFVRRLDETTLEADLMLDGLRCGACVWLNEHHISRVRGVLSVSVNYMSQRAVVRWNNDLVHLSAILAAVADIGYRAFPFDTQSRAIRVKLQHKAQLSRIFVAGIGMMQVMMYAVPAYIANGDMTSEIEQLMRIASLLLTLPVMVFSAQSIFIGAWRELMARHLGMDTPVALGIGAAFIASLIATVSGHGEVYFDSITMFVFFLLTGRYFEAEARRRAATQLENAVLNVPASATRLTCYPVSNTEERIAAAALRVGDHVLVRPGEAIPADGIVLDGASEVNESLLSGESMPVPKLKGAKLLAGATNTSSPLVMRVEEVGQETILSTLARLAERATAERPRIARIADQVASYFVLALLVLATAVGAIWWFLEPDRALATVISLLVVSCPCALSLAAPVSVTVAGGRLLRDGLLVTRSDAIEMLARATHFVFDKTGTLTEGRMRLTEMVPLADQSAEQCLALAQALQRRSEHPIARAINAAPVSSSNNLNAVNITNFPGHGIEGEIDGVIHRIGTADFVTELVARPGPIGYETKSIATSVLLGRKSGWLARFDLHDTPRQDAKATVANLRALGKHVALLSGDAERPVREVAGSLVIQEAHANMTPKRKLDYVRALQQEGAVVAMIGDGINDAPVLAGADVSLALGSGTDLAKIHADILVMAPELMALYRGARTARRSLHVIKQNLIWAFAYNFTAIPLAALGMVSPWMAALGMSASSLLVVLNALRLSGSETLARSASQLKLNPEGI